MEPAEGDHGGVVSPLIRTFQGISTITTSRAIVIGTAASRLQANAWAALGIGRNEDNAVVLKRLLNLVQSSRLHSAAPGFISLDRRRRDGSLFRKFTNPKSNSSPSEFQL